ncbi:GNAT family N-acetyltransferase [Streptomyces sp. AC563]|uniref:GNAT family N-acetyltransferase n=1 Tax=Streptomyces buecherae TaxID=2763006 RepID=UPI00164DADD8|nr:GNAT family N-acetyltransferase [Streptomyces buecherae]MBC3982271.1 GNAT family N-acetyltransferase [Streptomyces buecherae]MBC3988515.1 GNAT family N-acetyltransferase [Streptomyces buecherae]QNJ39537.1 GNAT family N-acetyltransferase [Streptomyces buecherae]
MGTLRLTAADLRGFSAPPKVRNLHNGYRSASWTAPAKLADGCRERIFDVVADVATRTFETDHSNYWKARKEQNFFDQVSNFTLTLAPDDEVVGWAGYQRKRFFGKRVVYLDAAGLLPAHRRSKLSARVQARFLITEVLLRNPFGHTYVVLRTQNPGIHAGFTKTFGPDRVFPQPDRPVPEQVQRLGVATMRWLGHRPEQIDAEKLVVREALGGLLSQLYGQAPRSGDPELDGFFAERIGTTDCFALITKASAGPLLAFMAREASRQAATRLGRHLGVALGGVRHAMRRVSR